MITVLVAVGLLSFLSAVASSVAEFELFSATRLTSRSPVDRLLAPCSAICSIARSPN